MTKSTLMASLYPCSTDIVSESKLPTIKAYFCSSIQLSLDTALKLQIPEEHDEGRQMRYYSLEDLRELQNKLMLMSGKGDQGQNEVDHFAEVYYQI